MTDAKKSSGARKPAEQPEKKPSAEKTPKAAKKGVAAPQAKAETPEKSAQKPPLPTIQPVGKPGVSKPAPPLPIGKPPQPPGLQPARPNLPGAAQPNPPAFPTARQPTGLFGSARPNARVTWEILPTHDGAVRIDLSRLSFDLFKLLGIRMPAIHEMEKDAAAVAYWGGAAAGTPSAVAQVISDYLDVTPDVENSITEQLDATWAALGFTGAVMVHNWREEAKVSFATRFQAMNLPTVVLRATDPLLVLNILSRARSGTLISNMPAALEKPFLERQLFTDDVRVIAWAKASGCTEEMLVEPAAPDDDETAEP